jgi:homoserine kinase
MPALFAAAVDAGALGACLSGAGSTILALAIERTAQIAAALERTAATHGIGGVVREVAIRARGAEIFES